jgi:hypothetical protein
VISFYHILLFLSAVVERASPFSLPWLVAAWAMVRMYYSRPRPAVFSATKFAPMALRCIPDKGARCYLDYQSIDNFLAASSLKMVTA